MHERHGIIKEKRTVAVLPVLKIFEYPFLEIVRSVQGEFIMSHVVYVTVGVTFGIGTHRGRGKFLVHLQLVETPVVKAELLRQFPRTSELPFSYHGRIVTGSLGEMCESMLVRIHVSESDIVLVAELAGHHLHPARTAERQRVHVFVNYSFFRHSVQVRSPVSTPVNIQTLGAEIVGKDKHYVRVLPRVRRTARKTP